ncbi:hypothetical protein RJ640_018463 [Escallonia rubra]|uniref:WPP domain-containing protein n=1 Tax=Escallonia rubra TaxID=112253 RepID=A0AA88U5B9_9ASTE|nr:hypothetical protein RJ640_018463 [Escallonia rubra]
MAAEAETLTLDSPPPQSQPEKVSVSFSIWPPTQRTRDAVLSRLIETLSLRPLRALQVLRPVEKEQSKLPIHAAYVEARKMLFTPSFRIKGRTKEIKRRAIWNISTS